LSDEDQAGRIAVSQFERARLDRLKELQKTLADKKQVRQANVKQSRINQGNADLFPPNIIRITLQVTIEHLVLGIAVMSSR
jgi:hypothetical protein